jgi:hypothetical protein
MSQPIPPDVEIPTLHQTVPSHWRTHPLEIPWVTERAPQPEAASQSPAAVSTAGGAATLELAASLAALQPALDAPATAHDPHAHADSPANETGTPEFEIEQLVNQVIHATTAHAQQAEDAQSEAEHQVLANQVVERVQARIASLLPDLVHEVMSEIQPPPADTGKPSDPQELK